MVTLLLEKGANVNKVALIYYFLLGISNILILQGNFSPLYSASNQGHLPIVQMLVSRGARIDQPCDVRLFVCMLIIVSCYSLSYLYTGTWFAFTKLHC